MTNLYLYLFPCKFYARGWQLRAALLLQSAGNIAGKALQGQSTSITDTHTAVQYTAIHCTRKLQKCTVCSLINTRPMYVYNTSFWYSASCVYGLKTACVSRHLSIRIDRCDRLLLSLFPHQLLDEPHSANLYFVFVMLVLYLLFIMFCISILHLCFVFCSDAPSSLHFFLVSYWTSPSL